MAMIALVGLDNVACADAMVVTKAMRASTIVEIFIEDRQVRIEFEIGADDVEAFANVVPDAIYEQLTGTTLPLAERLRLFYSADWIVSLGGKPLAGKVKRIVPSKRVARDDVTGEALAEQPFDAETVIRLTILYDLPESPKSLSFHAPRSGRANQANIGFVAHHDGLPVSDFRYLAGEVTIDLDWSDPWYSSFRQRNLRRQFDAPLSAYLYVEPYEVRKEIILRPKDAAQWVDLELPKNGVIPVSQQAALKDRIAKYLADKNPLTIDGQHVEGRLDRVHFVRRSLRTTGIVDPPVDMNVTSATLGVIFVYPVDKLPERVEMTWELFSPKIEAVPSVASDEAGGLPGTLTPDDPVLIWKNYLTNPTNHQMLTIAPPPTTPRFAILALFAFAGITTLVLLSWVGYLWTQGRVTWPILLTSVVAVLAIGIAYVPMTDSGATGLFLRRSQPSVESTREIVTGLLHNVYRSFDHHDEGLIYDRLAASIDGELVSDVYLETRKSMELKNQGGLRVSVKNVTVTELDSVEQSGDELSFRCRWQVAGWIGHWGHIHARTNEHVASMKIAAREGSWKITEIETLDEQAAAPTSDDDSKPEDLSTKAAGTRGNGAVDRQDEGA